MPRRLPALLVCLASFVALFWNVGEPALATAWIDPVTKIQAQDEAVYAHSSLHMVESGDWMTPRFLGRYALYKPPALYWASAATVSVLGESPLAIRLPVVIAGAVTVTLVFLWVASEAGAWAGAAAALLLLASHLFFVLNRTAVTDALLLLEIVAALFAIWRDPRLESRATLWIFGGACGLAIMTKALAGTIPVLIWLVSIAVVRARPRWTRVAQAIGVIAAVALPWHVWQIIVHPHWFWTEYILWEHFTHAVGTPSQTTAESPLPFYFTRLVKIDSVLLLAAGVALIVKRPRLPLVWFGVVLAATLAFQYRNASYLLPMLPAMAILTGLAIPRRFGPVAFAAAVLAFTVKAGIPSAPWGLPYAPEMVNPSYAALDEYTALHRAAELIVVAPDDQFYSTLLHLPRVRYAYLDPAERAANVLDFGYLGVTVTAAEFAHLNKWTHVYRERLREMDLDSTEPVATVILARNEEQMHALIAGHPQADFFVPAKWVEFGAGTHTPWRAGGTRAFLLSDR